MQTLGATGQMRNGTATPRASRAPLSIGAPRAQHAAGMLSKNGVRALFDRHDSPETTEADRVQMDAVINHLLGVQMLHRMFVAADVPQQARQEAERLGWRIPVEA